MSEGVRLRSVAGLEGADAAVVEPAPLLEQRLANCPQCGLLSAVHLDRSAWRVVRFVCPTSCSLEPAVIDALIAPEAATLSA